MDYGPFYRGPHMEEIPDRLKSIGERAERLAFKAAWLKLHRLIHDKEAPAIPRWDALARVPG